MDSYTLLDLDTEHVFDLCARYMARDDEQPRHNYLGALGTGSGKTCEAWRFPAVESHRTDDPLQNGSQNEVTFIYLAPAEAADGFSVNVRGTFAPLYEQIPLQRAGDTRYFAATVLLPAARRYLYRFVVNGQEILDPINPQVTREDNGRAWSQFFTFACFEPITFERWERVLLDRLTRHILPFNTRDAEVFLQSMGRTVVTGHPYLHRFDQSVGVVNFLDKHLAREERHQLPAYKTCLSIINRILKQRNPYQEVRDMPESMFTDLYSQMTQDNVPGWDYQAYGSPRYFLQMLRRHTFTGAFCHPKYGGNASAAAWAYISERYRENEKTLFDWRAAIEPPLGNSNEYFG